MKYPFAIIIEAEDEEDFEQFLKNWIQFLENEENIDSFEILEKVSWREPE